MVVEKPTHGAHVDSRVILTCQVAENLSLPNQEVMTSSRHCGKLPGRTEWVTITLLISQSNTVDHLDIFFGSKSRDKVSGREARYTRDLKSLPLLRLRYVYEDIG